MTTIAIITVGIVLAKVAVALGFARRIERSFERNQIPNEDSPVLDLNPRRGMSLAAVINLSRAVRRIH